MVFSLIFSGNPEVVGLLLQHGANPSKENSIGKTAAQLAAFIGKHLTALI